MDWLFYSTDYLRRTGYLRDDADAARGADPNRGAEVEDGTATRRSRRRRGQQQADNAHRYLMETAGTPPAYMPTPEPDHVPPMPAMEPEIMDVGIVGSEPHNEGRLTRSNVTTLAIGINPIISPLLGYPMPLANAGCSGRSTMIPPPIAPYNPAYTATHQYYSDARQMEFTILAPEYHGLQYANSIRMQAAHEQCANSAPPPAAREQSSSSSSSGFTDTVGSQPATPTNKPQTFHLTSTETEESSSELVEDYFHAE